MENVIVLAQYPTIKNIAETTKDILFIFFYM